ncbi:hypothetical protein [Thomasclavelia saccharogumia]|uniref:hypothetical protein n=1 Tax=Thomasclavelia saccharogumia TaxID=341225 RepID=UPI000690E00F|nr:hypothetical protein [Thomasclavelia saccharogumia]
MINFALLKQTIKSNWIIWLAMTAIMTVLGVQFASMEMTRPLLFTIFYGMMTTILPGIYVLITSNKLLASQVDSGSMAYILSTPIKRSTVVITQVFYMIVSLFLMFAITTIAHVIVNNIDPLNLSTLAYVQYSGELTTQMIIQINLSAFMVAIALAGVCFLFSGSFNRSKYCFGLSGVFVGESVLVNMLAMFGTLGVQALEDMKYLTICSLYDYTSILISNSDWILKMGIAGVVGVIGFILGSIIYTKKDLPL